MKIKHSISKIENTFLRRLCLIVMVPIVVVVMTIVYMYDYLRYFLKSLNDFFEHIQNDIDSFIDAIVSAWNGK